MFRATCLAMHCETSYTKHCRSVHNWQRARVTGQRSGKMLEIVAERGTVFNGFCNLSRNVFGRCNVCQTFQCFCNAIARQVARNIAQCDNAQVHDRLHVSTPLDHACKLICLITNWDFCVAYTKCVATLRHDRIYLFVYDLESSACHVV